MRRLLGRRRRLRRLWLRRRRRLIRRGHGWLHRGNRVYQGLLLPPLAAQPLETGLECGESHPLPAARAARAR